MVPFGGRHWRRFDWPSYRMRLYHRVTNKNARFTHDVFKFFLLLLGPLFVASGGNNNKKLTRPPGGFAYGSAFLSVGRGHGLLFWKEVLRELVHSMGMPMVRDKTLGMFVRDTLQRDVHVPIKVLAPTPPPPWAAVLCFVVSFVLGVLLLVVLLLVVEGYLFCKCILNTTEVAQRFFFFFAQTPPSPLTITVS